MGGRALNITFYGVRGSTPCPCDANQRYGGNTACVVVECDDADPVVLDLGTGLRLWGLDWPADRVFCATALVSHLHWDHIQGLPFFEPVNRPGAALNVFGPTQVDCSLADAINGFMSPPYFPVTIDAFAGTFTFTEAPDHFTVDGYDVRTIPIPHPGPTVGYRIERDGVSIAYLPDHQQPGCGSTVVSDEVRSLCQGVDLLIHDAQYSDAEFARKSDWGHCTYDYAMEVARQSGVRRVALFHHDPSHDDDQLDEIAQMMAKVGAGAGIEEVIVASERLQISLAPSRTR